MNLRLGPIPLSDEFSPESNGWVRCKEPGVALARVISKPTGILVALGLLYAWLHWAPAATLLPTSVPVLLLLVAWLFVAHELLHVLIHPEMGLGRRTIIGFWPKQLLFYAHYDGAMSRERFLVVFATPFVVLSVLPLIACITFGWSVPYLALVSTLNALVACVDIVGTVLIAYEVPRHALIRNQGWGTWWKATSPST